MIIRRIVFFLIAVLFALAGLYASSRILGLGLIHVRADWLQLRIWILALGALIGLIAGLILAPWIMRGSKGMAIFIEQNLQKTPLQDLIAGAVGLIIGLIICNLIRNILMVMGTIGIVAWVLITLFVCYLGISIAVKRREELIGIFNNLSRLGKEKGVRGERKAGSHKLLDTSVIIDGRIADLCESGFLEGTLLVPAFVLEELRHIADSEDVLKRNRGRRGLDVLNSVRKNSRVRVQIYDNKRNLESTGDVDTRLVKLAQHIGAKIFTNDYNLNKVAELHGVEVLNINELANAIKSVVLPGEEMQVQVIKDGKEIGQGVAYLDDGTMIVIDGGKRYVGQTAHVLVTSVLQTAAGRMIFAKLRQDESNTMARYDEVNVLG
ncbi:MAG: PilT protein domain protein [Desulfotomaculum sp. 46_296]|nr:MAG: PilT protein domain protein [Desulfotomaculum sp. 46_296]KUK84396.1 MAG: PilT protein domain protein [Desulfofundulus kuznetsovii]HAU31402.1 PIN domain nuclease [Desulfotomaculum sp.]